MSASERRKRLEGTGGVFRGEAPPAVDRARPATLEEMAQLAVDAWLLAGREIPSYSRHEAPGRVIRPCSD